MCVGAREGREEEGFCVGVKEGLKVVRLSCAMMKAARVRRRRRGERREQETGGEDDESFLERAGRSVVEFTRASRRRGGVGRGGGSRIA